MEGEGFEIVSGVPGGDTAGEVPRNNKGKSGVMCMPAPAILKRHRYVFNRPESKDKPEHRFLREQLKTNPVEFMRRLVGLESEYRKRNDKWRSEKKVREAARAVAAGKEKGEVREVEDAGSVRVRERIVSYFRAMGCTESEIAAMAGG